MKGVRGTGCKQTERMGQMAHAKTGLGARQNRTWPANLARQLLSWRAHFAVGARQVPSWRANFDLASKKLASTQKKPTCGNIATKQPNHKL